MRVEHNFVHAKKVGTIDEALPVKSARAFGGKSSKKAQKGKLASAMDSLLLFLLVLLAVSGKFSSPSSELYASAKLPLLVEVIPSIPSVSDSFVASPMQLHGFDLFLRLATSLFIFSGFATLMDRLDLNDVFGNFFNCFNRNSDSDNNSW